MTTGKRRDMEIKLDRLQAHLESHKEAIAGNELKSDENALQRAELVQKQLEMCMDNLLVEVDLESDLRMKLNKIKHEVSVVPSKLLLLRARIHRIKNQKNTYNEDNGESNIYEEVGQITVQEAQAHMMEQKMKNEGMAQMAAEMKIRAEETQRLESEIRDIEAIFSELNTIVHEQGELVDSIEENVASAEDDVRRGQRELRKAVEYKARNTAMTAAVVGGVAVGGPAGIAAGSTIVGVLGALGGVVTGFYGGNWLKRQSKKDEEQ